MSPLKKVPTGVWAVVVIAGVVVAAIYLVESMRHPASQAPPPPPASPSLGVDAAQQRAITDTATSFVVNYVSRSYQDPSPYVWVDKVTPLVTPNVLATLKDQANTQHNDQDFYVQNKMTITVTPHPGLLNGTPTEPWLTVNYTVHTSMNGQVSDSSASLTMWEHNVNGTWKVSEIDGMPTGSG